MKQTLLSVVALVCVAEVGAHIVRHFRHAPPATASNAQATSEIAPSSSNKKLSQKSATRDAATQTLSPDRASIDRSALLSSLEKEPAAPQAKTDSTNAGPQDPTADIASARDPFVPFSSLSKKRDVDTASPLTSTELADMRLAAVIKDSAGDFAASVETKQGKNFIVKRGAHIGTRGGQVVEITSSRVIISELTQDQMGKKSVRFRELAMRTPPPTAGLTLR